MRAYARLLDSSIGLPGGFRIGLDGIIGLVPGVGDAIAGLMSGYLVYHAHKAGASYPVLLRMLVNVGLEMVVGAIPIIGDVFDFVFKANERNMRLLEAEQADQKKTKRRSAALISLIGLVLFVAIISLAALVWKIGEALFQLAFQSGVWQ